MNLYCNIQIEKQREDLKTEKTRLEENIQFLRDENVKLSNTLKVQRQQEKEQLRTPENGETGTEIEILRKDILQFKKFMCDKMEVLTELVTNEDDKHSQSSDSTLDITEDLENAQDDDHEQQHSESPPLTNNAQTPLAARSMPTEESPNPDPTLNQQHEQQHIPQETLAVVPSRTSDTLNPTSTSDVVSVMQTKLDQQQQVHQQQQKQQEQQLKHQQDLIIQVLQKFQDQQSVKKQQHRDEIEQERARLIEEKEQLEKQKQELERENQLQKELKEKQKQELERQKQERKEKERKQQQQKEKQENEITFEERLTKLVATIFNQDDPVPNNQYTEMPWLANSNGFPSSYMQSKSHQEGSGLGIRGDGITSPVKSSKTKFSTSKQTVLIVGTSMIGGLDQKKMSRKYSVKVRTHPGATLREIQHHLHAHLSSKVDHLILQVGTNDAAQRESSAQGIFNGIMELKTLAEKLSPGVKVTVSYPMIRTDNNVANQKLLEVKEMLQDCHLRGLSIINNDNITVDHLSTKGLHLSQNGTTQLAKNMRDIKQEHPKNIAFIRDSKQDL